MFKWLGLALLCCCPIFAVAQPDPYEDWLAFKQEFVAYAAGPTGYYAIQDMLELQPGDSAFLAVTSNVANSRWSKTPGGHDDVEVRFRDGQVWISGNGIERLDLLKSKDQQVALPNGLIVRASKHDGAIKAWLYNPALPTLRKFKGLEFFPYDRAGVVAGTFQQKTTPVAVNHLDSQKKNGVMYWIGDIETTIAGKAYRLRAFSYEKDWDKIDYLLIFLRDRTSGKTSYGGGRVFEAHFSKNAPPREVTINLNKLYSFLCAHSSFYNCPVNLTDRIDSELRYGEKYPPSVMPAPTPAGH